ncbi:hypothetical protein ACFFMP_15660 [Pseudoroseomonas cervicalis]|uniref:Uncharacterized protein n=1 Tax=Pseudoroseomonas cervicalis ATCC 49957 TaxID=525371 RepID=D5RN48_9PROT|nr:hypothetical protein [Pseudoroseomonas cervicalis]EFH11272.1 hypothetical protein HMPREF0731_2509 [Pseudoroseomonas cervicalis ATCC 49957]
MIPEEVEAEDTSVDPWLRAEHQRAGLYRLLWTIVEAIEQAEPGYALPEPVLDAARAMLDLCAEG